eukprot:7391918-Prymnesium_polylepis.3
MSLPSTTTSAKWPSVSCRAVRFVLRGRGFMVCMLGPSISGLHGLHVRMCAASRVRGRSENFSRRQHVALAVAPLEALALFKPVLLFSLADAKSLPPPMLGVVDAHPWRMQCRRWPQIVCSWKGAFRAIQAGRLGSEVNGGVVRRRPSKCCGTCRRQWCSPASPLDDQRRVQIDRAADALVERVMLRRVVEALSSIRVRAAC